jgi:hypothetical protein
MFLLCSSKLTSNSPHNVDIEKAMMERVERPLLKSYLRFATREDIIYFCEAFFVSNCYGVGKT